ncbi:unnamed protein product, partial [Anisakis simplex]|uniref:RFX-like transcription factor daf-19 (inferred by orthology to a C. elegans protein) n=1 Tax=Anisakis simplex TaxID=6269 RepID=A0A0M3JYV9_ANISI
NATYVYTSDYPAYYQYQPILTTTSSPNQTTQPSVINNNSTYIIQQTQQNSPSSIDDDNNTQLAHTTRASPATIQWLINNYEPADGTSLPRCTLYSHYINFVWEIDSVEIDREALGCGEVPQVTLPDMHALCDYLEPLGLHVQHAITFIHAYNDNCAEVLQCIKQLQFDAVEGCWLSFWQCDGGSSEELAGSDIDSDNNDNELVPLAANDAAAAGFNMDFAFYQVIVDVLIPDVLASNMSSQLTVQIRNFAKQLEGLMRKVLVAAPDKVVQLKVGTVRLLSSTLRRYTSLNHLASAARGVLQRVEQTQQMYVDFTRLDVMNIHDQAGWVCDCDAVLVSNLQTDFRENLQKQKSLEQWADWMEAVVDQVLAKCHDKPLNVLADVAKQFLKNWSFYSSMIIRDLTLRSAQSFGSFHLIRLLYDEYLLYLVELKLAKRANKPVLSIMSQTATVRREPIAVASDENKNNEYYYNIYLDGRLLKTPRGNQLNVNSEALALLIANEWNTQKNVLDINCMRLCGLQFTAIDNPLNVQRPSWDLTHGCLCLS